MRLGVSWPDLPEQCCEYRIRVCFSQRVCRPIRGLIFDFDGLILDTESTDFKSWQEVFAAHGCEVRLEVWADCIGCPYDYFDPYAYLEQLSGMVLDREQLRAQRHARLHELNMRQPLQPGVLTYLQDAQRRGLKIGLASSSDRAWGHEHLERLALLDYFTTTKCVEDTRTHKPDPAPYLPVLETLQLLPQEVVAFEDSPHGIAAAKAAGIFCVAVLNPIPQYLPLDQADLQVASLASLSLEELLGYVHRAEKNSIH